MFTTDCIIASILPSTLWEPVDRADDLFDVRALRPADAFTAAALAHLA
jgi:hypothetical protein